MSDPLSATVLRGPGGAFSSAARSHVGVVRQLNEDRLLSRPEIGLWAVADGMGGHQAGDVASAAVIEALAEVGVADSGWALLTDAERRLREVNAALAARAAALGPGVRIGSTVVTLLIHDGHYACLWAGDSRAYLLRDGQLRRLSRDHSMVQEMVDAGVLTPGEAKRHRAANVITRAVGVDAELVLDIQHGEARAGDVFLLCSDGLTGLLDDGEIAARLSVMSLDRAADDLLHLTLERGAPDNVSVLIVRPDGR